MKKTLIAVLFVMANITLFAQNTFFKWYPSNKYEYNINAIEANNGIYILAGCQSDGMYASAIGDAYLLKIDSIGNIISQYIKPHSDTNTVQTLLFKLPNESNILNTLILKRYSFNNLNYDFLSFEKYLIDDYTLISQKQYSFPLNKGIRPQSVVVTDSSIYIQSILANYSPTNFDFIGSNVTRYNHLFDSISSYSNFENLISAFGIINDKRNQKIKSFTLVNGVGVKNLNYNLTISDSTIIPIDISTNASVAQMNNSNYLLTGISANTDWPVQHIKVGLSNMSDQIIDSVSYRNHPDSVLYCGFVSNTAMVKNKIFVVGNYQFNASEFPFQTTPTYIQITRIDTNMNIIDHHFYGYGDAAYFPFKIIETSDGGALITGMRYDLNTPYIHLYHPFALKLNSEGMVVTGIDEAFNSISHSAIVFPNPGKEVINLTSGIQLNNGVFTLFNLKGQPVITERINATEMQFNASNLASGTYIWQIELNHKIVEKGKWVKE